MIFGHSLASNDAHVLRLIERGRASNLYVSMFGDPNSDGNKQIANAAKEMVERRAARRARDPLSVTFFDAASAKVWG